MEKRKIKHTRKRYFMLAALFLIMALGLVVLPEKDNKKELKPEVLLGEISDDSRFFTVDEVAKMVISRNPEILLVDVRPKAEYEKISLEGAVNIPLKDIFSKEADRYLNSEDYKVVLFSNGAIYADQAWLLLRRAGRKNVFVMKGGLNEWVNTIMHPKKPDETASKDEFDKYRFRQAACRYFAGGSVPLASYTDKKKAAENGQTANTVTKMLTPKKKTKPKKIIKKAAAEKEEEGC